MSKNLRINIQRETIDYLNKNKSKLKAKIYKYNDFEPCLSLDKLPSYETNILVESTDTLESTYNLQSKYPNSKIGFLIFANASNPGGNYKEGTPAQEESICRRTDLVKCFEKMKYPIPEFGSFYIKDLAVIRNTEKNNYKFFDKIMYFDCVLSAAYHGPSCTETKLENSFREKTKIKIKFVLNSFLNNNVIDVVLGAFGCGAFGNPVQDIALIFKELLYGEYKNKFRSVIFAVLKDMSGENFKVFSNIFK